jgi:Leucine-rich repeat (LRR) protein
MGGLKQLVCLKLRDVPIKRFPPSLVNMVNLEILDLSYSNILELLPSLHKLRSLRYLYIHECTDLQYLLMNISRLTSLQFLDMYNCSGLWTKLEPKKRFKKVASIHNLGGLTHMKKLVLENNRETLQEGTFGNMD